VTFNITLQIPLAITTDLLPNAEADTPFSAQLAGSGGTEAGYVFSILSSSPALPTSFSITSGGLLTGNPVSADHNRYLVTIQLSDSASASVTRVLALGVLQKGGSKILLTELQSSGSSSYIEFSNTGTESVDISNWRVRLWSGGSTALTLSNPSIPIGVICVPGDAVKLQSGGTSIQSQYPVYYLGTTLSLSPQTSAALALYDSKGTIVDFVTRGTLVATGLMSEASPTATPAPVGSNMWDGAAVSTSSLDNISRTGSSDTNTSVDWLISAIGTQVSAAPPYGNPYNPGLPIAPLQIATQSVPQAFTGQAYSTKLVASGGTRPYVWSATSLPAWLTLDPATGVLSGTAPSQIAAPATFVASVNGGGSIQRLFAVEVVAAALHNLSVANVSMTTDANTEINFVVSLQNLATPGIAALNFQFSVPGTTLQFLSATIGSAAQSAGKSLSSNYTPGPSNSSGVLHVVITGVNSNHIGSGQVAILKFKTPSQGNMPHVAGNFPLTLSSVTAASGSANAVAIQTTNGVVSLIDNFFRPEDTNRDGAIDVVDVQRCVNLILQSTTPQYSGQGDVNNDSAVDVVDVQKIVNCILSSAACQ